MASYIVSFKLTISSVVVAVILLGPWGLSAATARILRDRLSGAECGGPSHKLSIVERHEQWMARFGRTYKDGAEKAKRFQIFKEEFERVESFNKAGNHNSSESGFRFNRVMGHQNVFNHKKVCLQQCSDAGVKDGARYFFDKKFLCLVFGVLLVWLTIHRS